MLKEYFEKIIDEYTINNLIKNSRSESELKRSLEYYERLKLMDEPEYCVRKKGLSNFYPIILDGWRQISVDLCNIYVNRYYDKRFIANIFRFTLASLFEIVTKIQKLWLWRNNLVIYSECPRLEGCEETIDEDGNPCLFHRLPPRTGKLKRIWNKLTFGVNDD